MGKKQLTKNRTRSTKATRKNKVCRRCELGYDSTKLNDISLTLDNDIASHEIGNVLLPKEQKLSLWARIKKWLKL